MEKKTGDLYLGPRYHFVKMVKISQLKYGFELGTVYCL